MAQMSATHVARSFSAVMNRVRAGERIEIVRNGAPIAELQPPAAEATISAAAWRDLMAAAPEVDDGFTADVERARASIGPPAGAWPS